MVKSPPQQQGMGGADRLAWNSAVAGAASAAGLCHGQWLDGCGQSYEVYKAEVVVIHTTGAGYAAFDPPV